MDAREPAPAPSALRCKNHPRTETLLRCNKCDAPICVACAVRTPVGYRCRDCIRALQDKAYTMERRDAWVAFGASFGLSCLLWPLLGLLLGLLGGFLGLVAAVLAGGAAGGGLAQIIRAAVQRRRGRHLGLLTLAGILAGGLVGSAGAGFLLPFSPFSVPLLAFVGVTLATAWPLLK